MNFKGIIEHYSFVKLSNEERESFLIANKIFSKSKEPIIYEFDHSEIYNHYSHEVSKIFAKPLITSVGELTINPEIIEQLNILILEQCKNKFKSLIEKEEVIRRWTRTLINVLGPNRDIPAPDLGTDAQTMAWLMDEFHRLEGFQPACVTGKPVGLFGAPGREEATGRGVAQITAATLQQNNKKVEGATVAIQGFGNVGRYAALVCQELGMKVIALSDMSGGIVDKKGIDIKAIFDVKSLADVKSDNRIGSAEVLEIECDVLIPAALGNVINDSNVDKIKAAFIVEGANQPIMTSADKKLRANNIVIVPDILANSGGVMGSYFEWTQNIQQFSWPKEKFRAELDVRMQTAFVNVNETAKKYKTDLRSAAFIVSVARVAEAFSVRGSLV